MLDLSVNFDAIYASLQELLIGNKNCGNADYDNDEDDAVGDMIPMCRPCFAGNTKKEHWLAF